MAYKIGKLPLLGSQLSIFSPPTMLNPFNEWDEKDVNQGFTWRPQSVSFATLEDIGNIHIYVDRTDSFVKTVNALRTLHVPFRVENLVSVSNLSEDLVFDMPTGNYKLVFETGYFDSQASNVGKDDTWCTISFIPV